MIEIKRVDKLYFDLRWPWAKEVLRCWRGGTPIQAVGFRAEEMATGKRRARC